MATFRVGVGSFNIQDGAVGFGTDTDGLGNLKVKGVTKTTGSIVSGASTLTRYSGFAADNINQLENITLTSEVGTIGDIVVGVGTSVIISSASTVTVGTVESVSIGTHFSPPTGGIADRGEDFVEGMMRFNTDFNTMEFYNGNEWRQFTYIADIQNSPSSRGRAVFGGGNTPSKVSDIDFVNISSLGNAKSFGDMSTNMNQAAGSASAIRGLMSGGYDGSSRSTNNDYITIASEGNAIDFGNLSAGRSHPGACNSSTRSLVIAGYIASSRVNTIDYVEMNTLGNSIDFGDSVSSRDELTALSSPTRGISAAGGNPNSPGSTDNIIDFVVIASKGNAVKFGELSRPSTYACGGGNGIRGIIVPGNTTSPSGTDPRFIDQITIASEGNATDFGGTSLTNGTLRGGSGCTRTRMVFPTGYASPAYSNIIEFININTNGNGQDFGDLTLARSSPAGLSDSNGGLGGY